MIIDFFLKLVISVFNFIASSLPNFSGLPQGLNDAFDLLTHYLSQASSLFPVADLLVIISLVISIEIALLSWKAFWFIYHKVRG